MIAIDLYVTGHIPFFTTAQEFFQEVKNRLTDRTIRNLRVATAGARRHIFTDDLNDVEFQTFRMFYDRY